MGLFSRIWERMAGSKRVKRFEERQLRLEPLEDHALLSVTPGVIVATPPGGMGTALNGIAGGAAVASPAFTDTVISLPGVEEGTAAENAAPNGTQAIETQAVIDWNLADYSDYTTFQINVVEGQVYLYGRAKDGMSFDMLEHESVGVGDGLTIHSNNTARDVTFKVDTLKTFGEILYIGGKTKNDTITLEGSDEENVFTMDQETRLADVYERPGKAAARQVVFETVSTSTQYEDGATVIMSGVRTIAIDAMAGVDEFHFIRMGTTYDLIGGDGRDAIDFYKAESGAKLNLGKTTAQSVLSGQKGKICLHGDIECVTGSLFNDSITTAANTQEVFGIGGSDTVNLVGDEATETRVQLEGSSQRVTGKGGGAFNIMINLGSKSTINMSSVKKGSMELHVQGDNVRVVGTMGNDNINVQGNNGDVQGNEGNDYIFVVGANAKARGGKGDDIIELTSTYGKCTLEGGEGNDVLIGGTGNDTIKARSGNNILVGGEGADKLIGGRGRDLLMANTTSGVWWSSDFAKSLMKYWSAGNVDETVKILGKVSVADYEKDILKRGGGTGNLFYANTNPLECDFDTVDYKPDKGDILFTDLEDGNL